MNFNVTILQPYGYAPALVFLEAAENVLHVLRRAGHDAEFRKNRILKGSLNVVFGAHIKMKSPVHFPQGTIIFNSEQLGSSSNFVSEEYRALLEQHYVWDYSEANLRCISHDRKSLFPFTYVPEMARAENNTSKDYELVFYGTESPKRRVLLDSLKAQGLRICEINGLFGPERDQIMSRTRAVLNLHFYESQILQQIRCFHPLTQGVPVISENYPVDSAPGFYAESLLTPDAMPLESFVIEMFADDAAFSAATERTISAFRASQDDPRLTLAINDTLAVLGPKTGVAPAFLPDRINLGSGQDYQPNWLNIDILERVKPDLLLDLSKPHAFPIRTHSKSFGEVVLEKGSIQEIKANDVLQYIPDLTSVMRNCLDLLRDGGLFIIKVPFGHGLGVWQDPATLRGFKQNSWLPYTDRAWELGWRDDRYDLTHTEFRLSALGQQLHGQNVTLETILNTPLAVDWMQVTLKKRAMTLSEKTLSRIFAQDWLENS